MSLGHCLIYSVLRSFCAIEQGVWPLHGTKLLPVLYLLILLLSKTKEEVVLEGRVKHTEWDRQEEGLECRPQQ